MCASLPSLDGTTKPHGASCLARSPLQWGAATPYDLVKPRSCDEFLEALADAAHLEHAKLMGWIGRPFDPRAFDIDENNARLNARE